MLTFNVCAKCCNIAAGGPFYNRDIASARVQLTLLRETELTTKPLSAPISRESSVALVSLNPNAFSRCASAAAQNSPTAFQFAITVTTAARSSYSVHTSQSADFCVVFSFLAYSQNAHNLLCKSQLHRRRHCFYQPVPGSKSHFQLIFHADPVQS